MLHDLWRFDLGDLSWHQLVDLGPGGGGRSAFGSRLLASRHVSGRAAVLSPWGLLALGGLRDQVRGKGLGV